MKHFMVRLFCLFVLLFLSFLTVSSQETATVYFEKAIVLQQDGEYETSVLLCTKAIELDSTLTGVYFLRGYNFYLLKNYREAIKDFTKAISLKPDYFEAWYYRSKARQARGDMIGSLSDLNQSRHINPVNTTFLVAKGIFTSIFGGSDN